MTEEYRRCENCRIVYTFQVSGWGAHRYNDPRYCPDCKKVICAALAKVMKLREQVNVPCMDFTKEEVLSIIKEDENARQKRFEELRQAGFPALNVRRVFPGLLDTSGTAGNNIVGSFERNGITYSYSWWEERDDDGYAFRLLKHMEKDLITGEIIGPWHNYDSGYDRMTFD